MVTNITLLTSALVVVKPTLQAADITYNPLHPIPKTNTQTLNIGLHTSEHGQFLLSAYKSGFQQLLTCLLIAILPTLYKAADGQASSASNPTMTELNDSPTVLAAHHHKVLHANPTSNPVTLTRQAGRMHQHPTLNRDTCQSKQDHIIISRL
jgi:hypothetical protein